MLNEEVKVLRINMLKEHEKIDPKRFKELKEEITKDGFLKKPIVADKKTLVVLDGHHRLNVLRDLGLSRIPVVLIDYNNPNVIVKTWKGEGELNKEDIINAALSGNLFGPRTSKHMVVINGELHHIEIIQREVNIPLEKLK
ncbi:MAG TPA: hypothetical protein EYP23_04355 [Thermoplasmata archaeon]|nr:hypothetical protein [Thermoplasmata archaeon]